LRRQRRRFVWAWTILQPLYYNHHFLKWYFHSFFCFWSVHKF
jgi:hypothetical protein